MWGERLFTIPSSFSVEVRNLATARVWYENRLKLRETGLERDDDSGLPFVDLDFGGAPDECITLIEAERGKSTSDSRPILFAKNLEKARAWLIDRSVAVGEIQADSGGNRFFAFQDLDGNSIEVCLEPR